MAVPNAPVEGNLDKILFLTHDVAGTNTAALLRGVRPRTVNSTILAYLGVATHADADTFTALDPVVVAGGVVPVTGVVAKIAVDASGRQIIRPQGARDAGGGVNSFGHPYLLAQTAVNSEDLGWLAFATHKDGAAYVGTNEGVVVMAGQLGASGVVKRVVVDSAGRQAMTLDRTLGGNGHVAFASGAAVAFGGNVPIRFIRMRADSGNAAPAYIGISTVTADGTAGTGGYQLGAGQQLEIEAANLNAVFLRSTAAAGVSFLYWT